jgi:gliding motility-associated-like protein
LSFNHTNPLCTGIANGTADVTATGGSGTYTYDWAYLPGAPDANSLNGIPAGIYDITVTDASNCSKQGNVTLDNPLSLNAQFINKNEITCANAMDGSVEVSVSGGTPPISFLWNDGSTAAIQNNLALGNYVVNVSDVNGCDTSLNVTFVAPPLISISQLNIDSVSCPDYTDGSILIYANGGTPGNVITYEYSIDGINFQTSAWFANLNAGIYSLKIRDSQGCIKDTAVVIYEPIKPSLNILPQDSTIKLGQEITLVSNMSDYTSAEINFYSWSPITGLSCTDCASTLASPYTHTIYTLTVNYLSNCSVSQTISVYVSDGEEYFVPNAFTPNGDGNNDVFTIYGFGLAKANLKIFNRWGEKIYDSPNQWQGWDGTYRSETQNPGVYTYFVEGVYLNGKKKEKKGTVTLIR